MTNRTVEEASYVSLATFRKNGKKVATPIWAAPQNRDQKSELVMFSDPNAGKVKRLRLSSRAQVAICDVRGKLLGDWIEAKAFLITDPNEVSQAEQAMRKKYGWQSTFLDFISRITGRLEKRQYIRIKIESSKP